MIFLILPHRIGTKLEDIHIKAATCSKALKIPDFIPRYSKANSVVFTRHLLKHIHSKEARMFGVA